MKNDVKALEDFKINVKLKLSALWASVMFLYIYGDYFGLYAPGTVKSMLAGKMPPFGDATQGVLIGTSTMMAIPSFMIFLSVALKANVNRWVNIIFGVVYTLIIIMTASGSWPFFIFLAVLEVALTGLVVWYAWTWPRLETTSNG
jgi:hypothetical protein